MAATLGDGSNRHLNHVVELLTASDIAHGLLVILDTLGKKISKLAYCTTDADWMVFAALDLCCA